MTTVAASGAGSTAVFPEDADQCMISTYCDVGDVAGEWSDVKFIDGQPVVVFRDVHNGSDQDDWLRSDVELVWNGMQALDAGWGGGIHLRLGVRNGFPAVAHWSEDEHPGKPQFGKGVWVVTYDGTTWDRTRVVPDINLGYRLTFDVFEERMGLAYQLPADQKLIYWESADNVTWDRMVVDQSGNTGFAPSLAFDPNGDPGVAYRPLWSLRSQQPEL